MVVGSHIFVKEQAVGPLCIVHGKKNYPNILNLSCLDDYVCTEVVVSVFFSPYFDV